MGTNKLKGLILLSLLMGIVGLLLIIFSDSIGISFADGGTAKYDYGDSAIYNLKVKANINKFLEIGGILFGIGLTTTILVYYRILSDNAR